MKEKLKLLNTRAMWQEYLYKGPAGSCQYAVYTPASYRVRTAVPLLIMLHGCAQTAGNLAAGTHMNRLAEKYNFIVAYPQQSKDVNRMGIPNTETVMSLCDFSSFL